MPGGQEVTPSDPLTGLPLQVLTEGGDFYIDGQDCASEFHHQHHPGNSSELGHDSNGILLLPGNFDRMEGLALRYSKGQDLPNWLHDYYHDLFVGPSLPKTSKSKHTAVLLSLANVVPRQAIHIQEPGAFEIVDLNDREHDFIRRTTHYEGAGYNGWRYNRRGRIGTYLADYALKKYLPEIIDVKDVALRVEHFIELRQELSKSQNLRWKPEEMELMRDQPSLKQQKQRQLLAVGESIVHQALRLSVEDSQPLFQEAIKGGMVKGTKRDLGQVAIKFFGTRTDYASTLEHHIANAIDGTIQTEANELVDIAA